MSGTHNKDRANTKPGDLRAEMSKRVGLTVEEQNRCRREGFSAAVRALRHFTPRGPTSAARWERVSVRDVASLLELEAERRWGPDWEVDG